MNMLNAKGFTLIELLAVIVIMGILMAVAIPAMTKYIDNSKKDTFVAMAKEYATASEKLIISNSVTCDGVNASELVSGFIDFSTDPDDESAYYNYQNIIEYGGKSPWGNKHVKGLIMFVKINGSLSIGIAMSDGDKGFALTESESLTRESIKANVSYPTFQKKCTVS